MSFDITTFTPSMVKRGTGRLLFPSFDKSIEGVFGDLGAFAEAMGMKLSAPNAKGERYAACPCGHEHTEGGEKKFSVNVRKKNFFCFFSGCNLKGCMFLELAAAVLYQSTDEGAQIRAIAEIARKFPSVVEEWAKHCRPDGRPVAPAKPPTPEQLAARFEGLCQSELDECSAAKAYLESRGIDLRTAKRCGVGFCSPTTARKLNASDEECEKAGILRKGKRGYYNPSKNGLNVILLQRKDGESVIACLKRLIRKELKGHGFYARRIPSLAEGQNPHMYSMGGNLPWRIDAAMEMAKNGGIEILFVVESVMDALTVQTFIDAAFESKRWCVIATLGTNGVKEDELVELIKTLHPEETVLIPDCDAWRKEDGRHHAPGQESGLKRAIALESAGVNVRVMPLPDGADPNDMSAPGKLGWTTPTFLRWVEAAGSPLVYRLWCMSHYYETSTSTGRQAFLDRALGRLKTDYHGRELPSELARVLTKVGKFEKSEYEAIHAKILETVLPDKGEPAAKVAKQFIRKWAVALKHKGKSRDEIAGVIMEEIDAALTE